MARALLLSVKKLRHFSPQNYRIVTFSTSYSLSNSSTIKLGILNNFNFSFKCFYLLSIVVWLNAAYTRDPGELFFNENVQILLQRLTGCDLDRVFRKRKLGTRLEAPKYELLTEDEVNKLMDETKLIAKQRLKMPPLIKEREPIHKVISKNPELQEFDHCKYLFTDISQGISDRVSFFLFSFPFLRSFNVWKIIPFFQNRVIVARDPDGVLREASWEERQKMCQVYFSAVGREIQVPKMFENQYLEVYINWYSFINVT